MSSRMFTVLVSALLLRGSHPAASAPIPITSDLPLDPEMVSVLRDGVSSDEFGATVEFLSALRVFRDDAVTGLTKVYLAPSFSADSTQEVIGGQEIATDLLDHLDALDALLSAIGGGYHEYDRLQNLRADHLAFADRLAQMRDGLPQSQRQRLVEYARNSPDVADLDAMAVRMTAALAQLSPQRRSAIAAALLAAMDALGVPLTDEERLLSGSSPAQFVLGVPSRVRARLSTMLLGVRHATFLRGIPAGDTRFFERYFFAAPGVRIQTLPIQTLRVVPIGSVSDPGLPGSGVSVPEMIRGVNASTGGVCGLTTQCTVLIEYTEMGARSALLSTRGASIVPAQFVGDVAVSASALITPTSCDIAALRQRLILPFGMDLLGDRELQRVMVSSSICRTSAGAVASPLSSAVTLGVMYRDLFYDGGLLSASQRRRMPAEIVDLLANVPGASAALGAVGDLLPQVDLDSFLDAFSRGLYTRLMPRFPDQLIAGLVVTRTAAPATTRFDFDGIAIACWKRGVSGAPYLSACPAGAPDADTQDWAARALHDRLCQQGSLEPGDCAAVIQSLPADRQGFLWMDSISAGNGQAAQGHAAAPGARSAGTRRASRSRRSFSWSGKRVGHGIP